MSAKINSAIFAISHRDPAVNEGGVETCIRREISVSNSMKLDYIFATPQTLFEIHSCAKPYLIILSTYMAEGGAVTHELLISTSIRSWLASRNIKSVIIHSSIGHSLFWLHYLVLSVKNIKITTKYFIHDFSFACSSFHLIFNHPNGREYCNILELGDQVCMSCTHGDSRRLYLRLSLGLIRLCSKCICPSEFMKKSLERIFELSRDELTTQTNIRPHYYIRKKEELELVEYEPALLPQKVITIGFYGSPVAHKGWYSFVQLATAFKDCGYLEFVCIFTKKLEIPGVKWIPFSAKAGDRLDYIACKYSINVFFFWNSIPEPYGLSFHEACATGQPVFCNQFNLQSGIKQLDSFVNIIEFSSIYEIHDLLANEQRLIECLFGHQGKRIQLHLSGMSFDGCDEVEDS